MDDINQLTAQADQLLLDASALLDNPDAPAEDITNATRMIGDAKALNEKASALAMLNQQIQRPDSAYGMDEDDPGDELDEKSLMATTGGFWSFGEFASHVKAAKMQPPTHKLKPWYRRFDGEPADSPIGGERKALGENIGATGGFLVPPEFDMVLRMALVENTIVRQRANIIPMRRRTMTIPVVDQTGTQTDRSNFLGGVKTYWTEEAGTKTETEPSFRQMTLTAHKLAALTVSSDELLDDNAAGLEAFLLGPMGLPGAIAWEEDWTFLRGTGAGQPLGVLNAGATITIPRAAAGTVGVADLVNMMQSLIGQATNPVWVVNKFVYATLFQIAGPAANPNYIFLSPATGALPSMFGIPVIFTEKLPTLGTAGDILLADFGWYTVGDRQATIIDSSIHYRFPTDQTTWRVTHRVDGQPWLSAPITLADGGGNQVSPFVILGDVAT